jgi:hypothetical protein
LGELVDVNSLVSDAKVGLRVGLEELLYEGGPNEIGWVVVALVGDDERGPGGPNGIALFPFGSALDGLFLPLPIGCCVTVGPSLLDFAASSSSSAAKSSAFGIWIQK